MMLDPRMQRQVELHPYPLLFVTISGAHLYGFPSPDSDFDLRGVHLLPLTDVVGLKTGQETVEKSGIQKEDLPHIKPILRLANKLEPPTRTETMGLWSEREW